MNNVKICVHQAADKIGGNCIEIVSKGGERLILDAGRSLDIDNKAKTPMPDTLDTTTKVAGVLISHPHTDHFGMLESIPLDWNVYCGKVSHILIDFNTHFDGKKLNNPFITFKKGANNIGSFRVTPYLIDHSAVDSYAFLIEIDDKKIFYSGDIRAHGRKSILTEYIIKNPPKNIDVLILEGTNLTDTKSNAKPTISEIELENQFVEAFKNADDNKIFVTFSAQNIDRIVTLYKATYKAQRKLVLDLYSMYTLKILSDDIKVPNIEWENNHLMTVITSNMKYLLSKKIGEENCKEFIEYLISNNRACSVEKISKFTCKNVILIRDSLVEAFSKNDYIVPNENDLWIYSMWGGYLKDNSTEKVRAYLKDCKREYIHTSGHASQEKLIEIANAINAKTIIPVHSENWANNSNNFNNINIVQNGEWCEIK